MTVDWITLFGLFAVIASLITYALEYKHPRFILAFAFCCALCAVYGFLAHVWPFGVAEIIWGWIALHKWDIALLKQKRIADAERD